MGGQDLIPRESPRLRGRPVCLGLLRRDLSIFERPIEQVHVRRDLLLGATTVNATTRWAR